MALGLLPRKGYIMINFGIIGAGSIAHKFADAVRKTPNAALVGIASQSVGRANEWVKSEEGVVAYPSYDALLQDKTIDAIYIATTSNFHFENIKMCLNVKKHVICEKPMVLTEAQATEVIKLAREKHLFLMEAMWTRFQPKSLKVKEWVAEGKIGNIKLMQANLGWVADPVYNHRLFVSELGGGSLYDLGVYALELLPYYTNQKIISLQDTVKMHSTGVNDLLNINLELEKSLANIQCSFTTKLPEFACLYGDKGYIKIPKFHIGSSAYIYDLDDNVVEAFEGDATENGFVYEVAEVVSCIEKGQNESSICPLSMTLSTAKIFDEILGCSTYGYSDCPTPT